MPRVRALQNFWERRMRIPVKGTGRVLDVGSGDKPHWRADVLLDWKPTKADGAQRSGFAEARVTRPLFYGDAADMPFADRSFDYVVCSHVLEHVHDPAAVLKEMMRVARAGYIEVPEAASAKIVDFPTHLWWVRLVDGVLDFEPKHTRAFDPEIAAYLRRSGLERPIEALLDSRFEHRVISMHWNNLIRFNVRGPADPAMLAEAERATVSHATTGALATTALATTVATVDRLRHRRRITFNSVVKPELRRPADEVLEAKIYDVGAGEVTRAEGA